MSDPNSKLYAIIAEKLRANPDVDQAELDAYVQAKIREDEQLAAAIGSRMLQINLGDASGFQTWVSGGVAYIGPQVHVEDSQLQALLEQLLQRLRPIGIPQNLPRSGATKFVGRDDDLTNLHTELQQADRLAITAIRGMGGIGKTELALQYASYHLQQSTYPGGICWLRARDQEIGTQIVRFAQAILGLTVPDGLDLSDQVAYCWHHWPEGDVLMIVDDVVDYGAIQAYLPPQTPRFWVLLTTRLQLGTSIQAFEIQVLTETAALQLLESLVGAERMAAEQATARVLCEWLGYLPLGLELVGRYLARKPDLSLAKLQERLEGQRLAAKALCQRQADMTAVHESAAAAFELSWSELTEAEQQLACVLSLFALVPIPWELVATQFDDVNEEDLEDWRDEGLVSRSLLQRVGAGTYQLHQLIREFFRAKLEASAASDTLKRQYAQTMVQIAQQVPPTPTREQIEQLTPAIPHLAEVSQSWLDWVQDKDLAWAFTGVRRFYTGQGAYAQAEPWAEGCLSTCRDRFGPDHPDTASSLNNLAGLYVFMGRYSEAEPLYQRALAIREAQLGPDHLSTATSLHNLALLYDSMGRYSEAEPLFQRALAIQEAQLGLDHPDTATSLNNLAKLYRSMGHTSEAEPLYQYALAIYEAQLGPDHPSTATSLNDLAALYQSMGHTSEAETLYQRALAIYEAQLGLDHPSTATSLNNLAELYRSMGRTSEAEPLYQRALAIKEAQLGPDHPSTATSLNNLAELYRSMGHTSEAEPLYQRALAIHEAQLGPDHPSTATSLNNLAELYRSMGRTSEAETLFQRALAIREAQLGPDHPDTATSLNNLAWLYASMSRYSEAEPLYTKALDILFQQLGKDHPNTQTVLNNFVGCLQQALQAGQADTLSDHPTTQAILQLLRSKSAPE